MIDHLDRFVALDVETTGLEKDAEIIEIGLVFVNNGKIMDKWSSFVKPSAPISYEITQITGITNKMIEHAPSWLDLQDDILTRLENRLLIAHNVPFDKARLEFAIKGNLANDWLDTHDLAKLFLPNLTSYKLSAIASHLGIENLGYHRALNDALVCAHVLNKLIARTKQTSAYVLDDMADFFHKDSQALGSYLKTIQQQSLHQHLYHTFTEPQTSEDKSKPLSKTPSLSFDNIDSFFSPTGLLAQNHHEFEHRPQQTQMLETICDSFANDKHSIIEAGTGTGKSFAYLVPAILWSYENKEKVIISTATISLQEQLFHHDIPFLKKMLGFDFNATISKGRTNYLCKRRFENICQNKKDLTSNEQIFYASLLYWQEKHQSGEREHLNLNKMEHQFWNNVSATADTCLGSHCHLYHECYYYGNRRAADQSHVIIVNHSLLLQDIRLKGGILPKFERVIIDEAHHLEEEATRQFTDTIDLELWRKNTYALMRPNGILIKLQRFSTDGELEGMANFSTLLNDIRENSNDLYAQLGTFIGNFSSIPELEQVGEKRINSKIRQSDWWHELANSLTEKLNLLTHINKLMRRLINHLEPYENIEELQRECQFLYDQSFELESNLYRFLQGEDDNYVYWAKSQKLGWGDNLTFSAARINIMPILQENLFACKKSVVLASATLAINNSLDYTANHFLLEKNTYTQFICNAPFDYANQSVVAIPTDHPDYSKTGDIAYSKNIIGDLFKLIPAVDGDMLVLFTSFAMLNRVYFALKKNPALKKYTILAHGQDGSRTSILATMQNNKKTVILGASSFWEGVDVQGSHLRTVVIAKLPFTPPTMPIESARAEQLEAKGINAFSNLSLPKAILKFRQGCGRLIRSKTDFGAVIILDNRVIAKNYGKQFINSMPSQKIIKSDIDSICTDLKVWMRSFQS